MSFSLCFPDEEKSCFACCPPIRPAGYEHIHYKNIIKRTLRENSRAFNKNDRHIIPVTGYNCWALGYINKGHKLVGCLLHPAQNSGVDLRYRIDYGNKCERESCQEEKLFSQLNSIEQIFWLHLADGLDSFAYSSKEFNPLFNMMGWGINLLRLIALKDKEKIFSRESFLQSYPFFTNNLSPRGNAYLLNPLINKAEIKLLKKRSFRADFEKISDHVSERIREDFAGTSDGLHVHLLDIDREFSDFLKISTGISKIAPEEAIVIKKIVDKELDNFYKKIRF